MIYKSTKKTTARENTIILPFREHIGQSVPKNRQYWALCGECVNPNGSLIADCEVFQMVKEKMITPNQFHGADTNPKYHNSNQKYKKSHWYGTDFLNTMVSAFNQDAFNPSVVNVDTCLMPDKGCVYFSRVMSFLSDIDVTKGLLLIGNFVLRNRGMTAEPDEIIEELQTDRNFRFAMNKRNWKQHNGVYVYFGNASDRTKMGSIVFYLT